MSILDNQNRNGNFSSSQNYKLLSVGSRPMTDDELKEHKKNNPNSRKKNIDDGFGSLALTYIEEKEFERKLKRSINTAVETRPILWGKFLEPRIHNMLSLGYEHINDITLIHPKYSFWVGSPDCINRNESVVGDMKCPQPKAFCQLVKNLTKAKKNNDISLFRDNHEDYYWQLVSNACITGMDNIELIVYMPYESELEEIRAEVENADLEEPWKYRFITESLKCELAYLPDDSEYKNLNIFRFPLNKEDAFLLENKVIEASILLSK